MQNIAKIIWNPWLDHRSLISFYHLRLHISLYHIHHDYQKYSAWNSPAIQVLFKNVDQSLFVYLFIVYCQLCKQRFARFKEIAFHSILLHVIWLLAKYSSIAAPVDKVFWNTIWKFTMLASFRSYMFSILYSDIYSFRYFLSKGRKVSKTICIFL